MCIFTDSIDDVSNTNIFAMLENGEQFLVYGMNYSTSNELAMVLPLPVVASGATDAVTFISLDDYAHFFRDMHTCFQSQSDDLSLASPAAVSENRLEVHDVGDYDASFVPTIKEFARLDMRFRLADEIWSKLPQYADYGFAVFKLKPSKMAKLAHPMALQFRSRFPNSLYFPTLHIHDGKLPKRAKFDHMLYCQIDGDAEYDMTDWTLSNDVASKFVDTNKSQGIVDGDRHCWLMGMHGKLKNTDTIHRRITGR